LGSLLHNVPRGFCSRTRQFNGGVEQKVSVEIKANNRPSLGSSNFLVGDEKIVAAIIKKQLAHEVTDFAPVIGRGMSNTVFIANTSEGKFVVRLNAASRLINFEKEAWCLERAHELGILVPQVLSVGCEGERSFSIAHYIDASTPINDGLDKLQLWETLGGYAAKLNSVDIESYTNCAQLRSWFGDSSSFISSEIEIIFQDDYWEKYAFLPPDKLKALKDRLNKFANADLPMGLCHWDIGLDNCIYANEKLYMLDLEFALLAPVPFYQLAVVARTWGLDSSEMKAFSRGYGINVNQFGQMEQDLLSIAALLRLRSVRWAQDRAPEQVEGMVVNAKRAVSDLLDCS